jgi:hypothetical protein
MFRKTTLIFLMCLLLVGAITTGVPPLALLMMGGLVALAFFIAVPSGQQEE